MSGKYVPPARRRQAQAAMKPEAEQKKCSEAEPAEQLLSLEEIKNHFWPLNDEPSQLAIIANLSKTLHDSAETPGQLAFVILFSGAHPRWEADNIIFTKSNLDLLPTEHVESESLKEKSNDQIPQRTPETSNTEDEWAESVLATTWAPENSSPRPIAVFKQASGGVKGGRAYEFVGWFQVNKVQILQPGSPELVRMLEQKWSRTNGYGKVRQVQRDEAAWKGSLGQRWAVVKMEKDETTQQDRGILRIGRLPDRELEPQAPKKSVNELLVEMRLGGGKKEGAVEA